MKMGPRIFLPILVVALVLALASPAFAAWSSYQKSNQNNGILNAGPPYPLTAALGTLTSANQKTAQLPTNGTVFSGVDVSPVINSNYAYVLYNGGAVSGSNGGARLTSYNVNTAASVWNIQLDSRADNVQQLSTPYLDTSTNTLYAAVTYYANDLQGAALAGWKDTNNQQISNPFSIAAGASATIHYDNLTVPSDYWEPQLATDLSGTTYGDYSGSMTLTQGGTSYNLGTSSYFPPGTFTLYNQNSSTTMVPAGTYTLTVTLTNNTGAAKNLTSLKFLTSRWALYKVTNIGSNPPTVQSLPIPAGDNYGQIDTHLNWASSKLYYGLYEGKRCYCQYDTTNNTLTKFRPAGGEDFYWAGAARVSVSGTPYMVFGSDSGTVYVRPIGANFGNLASGNSFAATVPSPQRIRSSIVDNSTYVFFTSQNGYAYKIADSALLSSTPSIANAKLTTTSTNSTATPVVTDVNNRVYVSYYNYGVFPTTGGVVEIPVSSFNAGSVVSIYSGDSVQAPVTSWRSGSTDYLYFTTNTYTPTTGPFGKGYCYSFDGSTVSPRWNTTDGNYTLQGFAAADNGRLVFGNDANTLFFVNP